MIDSTKIDKHTIYALAINALSDDNGTVPGHTDIAFPDYPMQSEIGFKPTMNDLVPGVGLLGIGYRLGLLIGAEIGRNPFAKPDVRAAIGAARAELEMEARACEADAELDSLRQHANR